MQACCQSHRLNVDPVTPDYGKGELMSDPTEPHTVDEDVEANIGEELPDPWADPKQTDWPQNEEENV